MTDSSMSWSKLSISTTMRLKNGYFLRAKCNTHGRSFQCCLAQEQVKMEFWNIGYDRNCSRIKGRDRGSCVHLD